MSASVTSCHFVGAVAGSVVVVAWAAFGSGATGGVGAVSTAARSVEAADEPAARPRDGVVAGCAARALVEDGGGCDAASECAPAPDEAVVAAGA
jgi:hypothetical protein